MLTINRQNKQLLTAYFALLLLFFYPVVFQDFLLLHQNYALKHHAVLDVVMIFLSFLGDGAFAYSLIFVLLLYKIRYGFSALIAVSLSGILAQLLKRQVFTDFYRPWYYFKNTGLIEIVEGVKMHSKFSFPSGHSTTAFALFLFFALISKNTYLKWGFFVLAILICYSRVYLSQHFFRDIYAGSVLGCTFAIIGFWLFQKNAKWMEYSPIKKFRKS